MDKLKIKLLIILFGLLSIFNSIALGYILLSDYNDIYAEVEEVLDSACSMQDEQFSDVIFDELHREGQKDTDDALLYVGYEVYTVTMQNGEVADITDHHSGTETYLDIEEVVKQIIISEKEEYIGNLYHSTYAYRKFSGNYAVVCTKSISQDLVREAWNQILLYIAMEFVAYAISSMIVRNLLKPIKETFAKQKQFVADASHELKTPLAVIMASCEALINEPEETKWLYNIENESERMNALIVEMLDLAKLDSDQQELITTEINLSKLLEKTILVNEALLFEKNILLDDDIEENIFANVNENQIKQVIGVLLDNASKYADNRILVSLKRNKKYAILKVCNDGQMISDDETTKIFERFYKSDRSRNRDDNHYGLGLAIAKSIIEAHHGTIRAYSENGLTTFEINLRISK